MHSKKVSAADDESPETGPSTVAEPVTITAEPEVLSPRNSPELDQTSRHAGNNRQHSANVARRLSGRPAPITSSLGDLESLSSAKLNAQPSDSAADRAEHKQTNNFRQSPSSNHVLSQVRHWLHQEKARRIAHQGGAKDGAAKGSTAKHAAGSLLDKIHRHAPVHRKSHRRRPSSELSDGAQALEKLEQILTEGLQLDEAIPMEDRRSSYFPRRKSSRLLSRKRSTIGGSSDTDHREFEDLVPSADVVLDNSKTLGYSGGAATSVINLADPSKRAKREKETWFQFKTEIVRLAHTLKLRGWRRVPIDRGGDIEVVRLSGALTNAVYVVSPPTDLPPPTPDPRSSTLSVASKRAPSKLLLRIYGPQTGDLIDREVELQILKRLAQKSIGPRMLGTFTNGRFEQYFNARTLTAQDIRQPGTSMQIAKRMRELHDGIDLLEEEISAGPSIWQNWDKLVQRCEEIMRWIDQETSKSEQKPVKPLSEAWMKRGFVCGVPWPILRQTVDRYRTWLSALYGGSAAIARDLIFAHNDTQYGNLLRLEPGGESPLLIPANEHKQLVVIDFEYASANVPGLEFANHFTEWCYDYHEKERPYALKADGYPTQEEQRRFLDAYVQHRPFPSQPFSPTKSATPSKPGGRNPISSFVLDSRAPPAQFNEDEKRREEAKEAEIERLMRETRLWRVANSAFWIAWGIVQAKVPSFDEFCTDSKRNENRNSPEGMNPQTHEDANRLDSDPLTTDTVPSAQDAHDRRPEGLTAETLVNGMEVPNEEDDDEGFDYLGYAQERAMFFWGDVLQLGIVKKDELPQALLEKIKIVEH